MNKNELIRNLKWELLSQVTNATDSRLWQLGIMILGAKDKNVAELAEILGEEKK